MTSINFAYIRNQSEMNMDKEYFKVTKDKDQESKALKCVFGSYVDLFKILRIQFIFQENCNWGDTNLI